MSRLQAGGLFVLILLAVVVLAGGVAGVEGTAAGVGDAVGPKGETLIEADRVEFRITVFENASGRWTFTYTRTLDNGTERSQFESFAAEFNRNETDAYRQFREQGTALARAGRNATGREMAATDFSRRASVEEATLGRGCPTGETCGVVRMSFTWTGFARQDGDRLIVGDVFGTGLVLSEDQQLVFEAGPDVTFDAADPDTYTPSGTDLAGSDSITYEGEQEFSDRRPRVVFVPATASPGSPTPTGDSTEDGADGGAGDGTEPATSTDRRDEGGFPMALLGGVLVVLVGASAAFVWWRGGGSVARTGGGDGGAAAGAEGTVADDSPIPDEHLLTDEDRVLQLLQDNGGRMKQVDIVDETGWSKSKVSMLLSDMEDEDQISKLRVGRENIVSLAGHEPEAAGSPHEDE